MKIRSDFNGTAALSRCRGRFHPYLKISQIPNLLSSKAAVEAKLPSIAFSAIPTIVITIVQQLQTNMF
jgi:hypothetical protein